MMEDFLHAKSALAKFDVHANQLNLKTIEARDAYPLRASKSAKIAADILMRLFKRINTHVSIRLWNGLTFVVGSPLQKNTSQQKKSSPAFTLVIHQPKIVRLLVINNNPMLIEQSYFNGDIDIEGDFFAAIGLKNVHLMALPWRDKLSIFFKAISLPNENQHHHYQYQLIDTKHYTSRKILKFGKHLISHTKPKTTPHLRFIMMFLTSFMRYD